MESRTGHWVSRGNGLYHFLPLGNNDIMKCGQVIYGGKVYAPVHDGHIRKCKRCLKRLKLLARTPPPDYSGTY